MSMMTTRSTFEVMEDDEDDDPGALSCGNYTNLLFWFIASFVMIAANFNMFGKKPVEVINSIPTFVTPGTDVFSSVSILDVAWEVVFGYLMVFAIIQMFPGCRSSKLVKVITPWFCIACICHVAWTILICDELVQGALIVMVCYLVALLFLALLADTQEFTFLELYLIRFPFSFHLGWVMVMTVVNLNMAVITDGEFLKPVGSATQVSITLTSLTCLVALLTMFAVAVSRPDPFVCAIVSVSFFYASLNLNDSTTPKPVSRDTLIVGFYWVNLVISFLAACFTALAVPLRLYQRCCMKKRD